MKRKIIIFGFLTGQAATVLAVLIVTFPGWDRLAEMSPIIVIARCGSAPIEDTDDGIFSDIDVTYALKGINSTGTNRLWSSKRPRPDEYYLIFSTYHDGSYQALEDYRMVPLGMGFSSNSIAGKPLDKQIRILFQQSVQNLNREIQKNKQNKERLEEYLKK